MFLRASSPPARCCEGNLTGVTVSTFFGLPCLQLSAEAETLALQLEDAAELNAALREQAERLVLQQRQKQRRLSVLREQRHGLMEVALAGMQQVRPSPFVFRKACSPAGHDPASCLS